jgi:hypothetical protein
MSQLGGGSHYKPPMAAESLNSGVSFFNNKIKEKPIQLDRTHAGKLLEPIKAKVSSQTPKSLEIGKLNRIVAQKQQLPDRKLKIGK